MKGRSDHIEASSRWIQAAAAALFNHRSSDDRAGARVADQALDGGAWQLLQTVQILESGGECLEVK